MMYRSARVDDVTPGRAHVPQRTCFIIVLGISYCSSYCPLPVFLIRDATRHPGITCHAVNLAHTRTARTFLTHFLEVLHPISALGIFGIRVKVSSQLGPVFRGFQRAHFLLYIFTSHSVFSEISV